jgi:predicted nucleic-acid-binding Zn-ribbon protein
MVRLNYNITGSIVETCVEREPCMEHLCPKCNSIMTKCIATSTAGKFSAIKLPVKNFTKKESSQLFPFVCPICGYTEWYAEKPENLK